MAFNATTNSDCTTTMKMNHLNHNYSSEHVTSFNTNQSLPAQQDSENSTNGIRPTTIGFPLGFFP
jgi:hypothetical protein